MNRKLLISVTLLVFSAFAVEGHSFTGKQYAETCQELRTNINSQSLQSAICLTFMMGVIGANYDSHQTVSELIKVYENALRRGKVRQNREFTRGQIAAFENIKKIHCIRGEGLSPQQGVLITLEYLRKNPAELKYQAVGSILTSLHKALPCSR
jgi:hypothetical protein